jgi:hypothetical protein
MTGNIGKVTIDLKEMPAADNNPQHTQGETDVKHLGLWEVKPRPPPRMAKAQPTYTEPWIDYSDSHDAPSGNGLYDLIII